MAVGYGDCDDPSLAASTRVEERVALARSMLPSGPGSPICNDCGEEIPEARRKALQGVRYCVDCQSIRDENKPTFKEPWAT